jgi:hypothetical protein
MASSSCNADSNDGGATEGFGVLVLAMNGSRKWNLGKDAKIPHAAPFGQF